MYIARKTLNHIVPTRHNGFVPQLLHEFSIVAMLIVALAFFSLARVAHITGNFGITAEVYPAVIVSLTNEDRGDASLKPLALSATLTHVAQLKADDMAKNGYFAHTSPAGLTPWYWFGKAGYKFVYAGENLAVNFSESKDVQTAWLKSPTHRANIMSANFTEIGIATAKGFYNGKETTFVVEAFGMPAVTKVSVTESTPTTPQKSTVQEKKQTQQDVTIAGESVSAAEVFTPIREVSASEKGTTTAFISVKNEDTTIVPAETNAPQVLRIPWYKRFVLHSESIAGTVITLLIILLFFSTTAMVAREYEKHHIKHMVYGSLMMVILVSALFIGKLGVFRHRSDAVAYRLSPIQVTE